MSNLSKALKLINLLYVAGFFVMLFLGFLGIAYFAIGLAIFAAGVVWSLRISEEKQLKSLGMTTIVLFLFNLVFFSTVELLPLLDVSFAIYIVLIGNLILLNFLQYKSAKSQILFPHLFAVAFFLFSIGLSGIFALHVKDVIYFFVINLGAVVVFYASINLFQRSSEFAAIIIKAITGLGLLSAVFAVWQLYSDSFKFLVFPYISLRDQEILELWEVVSRVVGTWQHPSYLGIYLAIAIPLGIYSLFYASKTKAEKVFWVVSIVFMGSTLLLTNTRSSVLAGFLGVVLMYVFANHKNWEFAKRFPDMKKIITLGLLLVASIVLYQFVFVTEIYTKPQAYRVDASATIWGRFIRADSMSTESLIQRSQLYALASNTFLENPWTGVGAKNFPFLVEREFEKGTDAHNLILQTAAEMGIVGVAAVAVLYLTLLWKLARLMRSSVGSRKYLGVALLAVTLLILFDSIFNNPLYSLRIIAVFWILVALQHINPQTFGQNINQPSRLES